MKRRKIIIIIHSLEMGGAEGQVYELARGLDRDLYQVVVCTLTGSGPYIEKLRAEGIQVEVVCNRLRQLPWNLHKIIHFLRGEKFAIVQNVMFTAAVVGTLLARVCAVPVVINSVRSLGFLHFWYRRPIKRMLYKISNCVVANSLQTKSLLVEKGIASAAKIRTIYNGVDTDRFSPTKNTTQINNIRVSLGIEEKSSVVGMIANLSPVKNHECLLRAIPLVIKEIVDAKFLVIGSGSMRERLANITTELGIQQSVFFWANAATRQSYCS